ncbi:BF3164 family lipoprotein [Aquiflexum sp.]|uniref:BF3164 family lipoprotein n=1 Tax=Aquiflexum sp. TaxID=1872584 RepID=UPI0035931706
MSSLPAVFLLPGKKHVFEEIIMPGSLLFKQDKLVISDKSENGYLSHIIDTDSWKYLYPMGVIGYGPGETPSVWAIESGLDPDYFWTYSLTAKTFSQYPLKETPEKLAVRQIKQKEDFFLAMGLTWSSDSTMMTYLVRGEDKFVEFKIDGTRLKGYGKWKNTIPGNYSDEIIASLHKGKLMGNPKTNKFLKACILRDHLEILDKMSGVIISIDGPLSHIPQFKVAGSAGNQSPIVQSDQPLAYMDAFLGDDFLFGLYSGKTDQEIMELGRGETEIFVFDLNGEVRALFNLDTPISAFTVDEANKRIFGITVDKDPGVVVFDYNL